MAEPTRQDRLMQDGRVMDALRRESSIFDYEASGDPADRYTIMLRGKGITRRSGAESSIEIIELHRCDMRLSHRYPQRPPDVRWLTPIFHPNISFSGYVNLVDIGLPWNADVELDVVCERLWDVARMAYLNLDRASNYAAKSWFSGDYDLDMPTDNRPLRDKAPATSRNVVKYRRVGQSLGIRATKRDVLYIDEHTPTPDLPIPQARRAAPDDEDDVLFIGED